MSKVDHTHPDEVANKEHRKEPRTGSYLVKVLLHWDALYNTCVCITRANSFSESNASSQCAEREVEKLRG